MCETQPLRSSPALPTPWSQRPPRPQTFSPSFFGLNLPGVFLVLGGGSICVVKVFATSWQFLPPSLPLNVRLTFPADPLRD